MVLDREKWEDMDRDQEAGPGKREVGGHGQRSRGWRLIERSVRKWTEIKRMALDREKWEEMDRDQEDGAG